MQDRTINNALLALRKEGGPQGKLAEVLLDMRGVDWSGWVQDRPFRRGEMRHLLISELKAGPKLTAELGAVVLSARPEITKRSATHRAYQALHRLEDRGQVTRDGCLWRLAQ